jgi:hypothetical protein
MTVRAFDVRTITAEGRNTVNTIITAIRDIQNIINETYRPFARLSALLGEGCEKSSDFGSPGSPDSSGIAHALEDTASRYERGVIEMRNLCERYYPANGAGGSKPASAAIAVSGKASVNEYGWLYIEMNALLPHCRYTTPAYLTDTITRLLDEYEARGRTLPRFDAATLIIDEYCDIDSRTVYDQDNKGWKAIPNALKGRLIPDDDQFTLHVCLLSTRSKDVKCSIWLIPQRDAGDFFYLKSEDMLMIC